MLQNKNGMTLIEIMIALLLLMITSLALVQTALLAINTNAINALRDEAVGVAEQRMNELRNRPFTATTTDSLLQQTAGSVPDSTITRTVRNYGDFAFNVTRTVTSVNTNCVQVALQVAWSYKNKGYTHGLATIVSRK